MSIEGMLRVSDLFDRLWYLRTYPDVVGSGLDPLDHFLRIGMALGRAPCHAFDAQFYRDMTPRNTPERNAALAHLVSHHASFEAWMQQTDKTRLGWALDRLERRGRGDLALSLARRWLPDELAASADILAANHALSLGNHSGWLAALNRYFKARGQAAVTHSEGKLFSGFGCSAPPRQVFEGPLVSVILCVHNGAHTLEAALASVLAQSWQRLELIAVDDHSDDATPQILARWAAREPRMNIIRTAVNVGPYVARNLAMKQVRGDWVTCHDADEWAHPARLAEHMLWLANAGLPPASQPGMLRMTEAGRITQFDRAGGHTIDGVLRPCPSGGLFDVGFLRSALGSWECARFGADAEMYDRASFLLGQSPPVCVSSLVLSLDHPASLTNQAASAIRPIDGGVSPARATYIETQRLRREARVGGTDLHYAFPPTGAEPPLPKDVAVPREAILACCASL